MRPVGEVEVTEEFGDIHHLARQEVAQVLSDAEQIGFVDVERLGDKDKLLFNGHLFRRDAAKKINAVLGSLSQNEEMKLIELTELLKHKACIPVAAARAQLGGQLFEKATAIGLYDINVVSNSTEEAGFVTLPSAFAKFSNAMVDDAFDLAKAFVSSITYGMTRSPHARGQIQMVDALLSALIRGESVGPVRAIAEDYRILELKGVVHVTTGTKKGRTGPMLKLLKKEVGELAYRRFVRGMSASTLSSRCQVRLSQPSMGRSITGRGFGALRQKSAPKRRMICFRSCVQVEDSNGKAAVYR